MKKRLAFLGTGTLFLGLAGSAYLHFSATVPASFQEIKAATLGSELLVRDRQGRPLHRSRLNLSSRHLGWVALADIPPPLVSLVLRAEDKRFRRHGGIDWLAFGGSAKQRLSGLRLRGASTISMQLASLLDPTLRPSRRRRGVVTKIRQMKAAVQIEKAWSKDEILEAYLNLASFRGELLGVMAASQGLYGVLPSGLSEAQSAVLTVLLRAPADNPARVSERACRLVGQTDCASVQQAALEASNPTQPIASVQFAPHLARRALRFRTGADVHSTLDGGLQRFAIQALNEQLSNLNSQNVQDAAILVVNNHTGEVLAYVGSSGPLSSAPHVDGVMAKRQAGSTLKSFLYAAAFDARWLAPDTLLEDSPLDIPVERGVYRPRNHDHLFHGDVTVTQALGSSLNVPAVRTLLLYGPSAFARKLQEFGIGLPKDGEHYGPALALGAADVSLWELVGAYRALARGGIYGPLHFVKNEVTVPVESAPVSAEASALVANILSDRDSRALSFGFENTLATRFWTAVKTGTSKDMRDNWCIGFSDTYTVGVWVGNFSGEPMWRVSGVTGAAPIWLDVMRYLHTESPSVVPPAVVKIRQTASKTPVVAKRTALAPARITYPADGTFIALDPDIPDDIERVLFEAKTDAPRWRLNGNPLAGSIWSPKLGRHELELLGRDSHVIDRVAFTVK